MNKFITILGDSLAMPRIENGIFYTNTYGYLLQKLLGNNYLIHNRSKRGNTTLEQCNYQYIYDDIEVIKNDIIIIHLGICDCSPRIIRKNEKFILNFLPITLRNYYIKFKSKHRRILTKFFPYTYVNKKDFQNYLITLINSSLLVNPKTKFIFINIANTSVQNDKRSFNFRKYINTYNNILNDLSNIYNSDIINFHKMTVDNSNYLLEDGIHITKEAHSILANKLYNIITNY